ncbi:MAG: multidrug effflux MFS transporter [Selenomonadaceae bacterium]|nr:multidrug effflux MFS transporter [Selenomonadaceae bacterium]
MEERKNFRLTVFLGILAAMAPLATDMYLPALPSMLKTFGINASMVQLTLTMTMAGMAVGQLLAGPVSDMLGRRLPLIAGMAVFGLSSAGCAFSEGIGMFLVCRFLQGLSGAVGIVNARAIARDLCTGRELTRFFSMLMLVNGIAPVISPVIGGQMLRFASWRGIFLLLTVIGVLLSVSSFFFRETLPKERRIDSLKASFHTFGVLLRDKYFMGNCLVQWFFFGGFFAYISGSSFLFQNIYHVTPQEFSLIFGSIGIVVAVTGGIAGRMSNRFSEVTMLKAALRVANFGAWFFLACVLVKAPLLAVMAALLSIVPMVTVIGAMTFSLAMRSQGKNAGGAAALLGFFSMLSGGMTAPLVGIMGEANALPMAAMMIFGSAGSMTCYYKMILPAHSNER